MPQRPGDLNMHDSTRRRFNHRFDSTFSAISQRQFQVIGVRPDLAKSLFNGGRYLKSTQTFLIRVWCDHYFHKSSLRMLILLSIHPEKNRFLTEPALT
ncbi:hypothetical protein B581_31810 [Salmonella enterica subsp. enterica serovar Typhimurium str. STm5]|nr:hypothetical protein B581_31810 [Salmonella enterica subsp. enterica serovar Typhimurium str. STm5]